MQVKVIFIYDEADAKWEVLVEGVESPQMAKQAFNAVAMTCESEAMTERERFEEWAHRELGVTKVAFGANGATGYGAPVHANSIRDLSPYWNCWQAASARGVDYEAAARALRRALRANGVGFGLTPVKREARAIVDAALGSGGTR